MVGRMSSSCARCGAVTSAGARFCAACGAPLEAPGGPERKLATLVFADLVGSTALVSERDPEDARRLLEPFFEVARTVLEQHGGRVEKFIGDAVVAVFGVPRIHGDDPDRAVAAAIELVARLGDADEGLELRVGIESGEVLATSGGGDLAVTGEPAHAAARLQQAAAPGEILVGERAAGACRTAALDGPHAVSAKGFAEPLRAWRVLGRDASTREATPFLGRGGELEILRLAYMRAVREREPRLVLVTGEAGVGKTRLVRELLGELEAEDPSPAVLIGRNPPYGHGIAFWALAEILRAAAGAPGDAGAEAVREALSARLAQLGATHAEATAETLAASLSGAGEAVDATALARAWRRLLAELAGQRPLVIAVEDAHWADEGFLELLEASATLPGSPLLVICTARPEIAGLRPDLGAADGHQRLALRPLTAAATEELAAQLVDGGDPALSRRIAETSAGNPFFAEEIAHAVATGAAATGAPLPDTVQATIAARIDALPEREKRTLQLASVLGERFPEAALTELRGEPVAEALAELERRHLVGARPGEPGIYRFHHQLIRDVGYASLTRAERVRLHELAAAGLRARAAGRHGELIELIAFHLAQAAELDPGRERESAAFEAVTEASAIALQRGAAARAQELLEQAAGFAADDVSAAGALAEAADVAMGRMRGDETYRLLLESAERAARRGDGSGAARLWARAVEVSSRMAGISGHRSEDELRALLARAETLDPEPGDDLRAHLILDQAWLMWHFDRPERMAETAAEALALARRGGDTHLVSSTLDAAAAAAWAEGRYDDAVEHSRARVELLDAAPDRTGLMAFERSDAFAMLTDGLVRSGQLREALGWVEANMAEIADTAPHVANTLGVQALYMLGEWDAAIERSAGVRENWLAAGRPPFTFFAPSLACVAAIYGLRGEGSAERDWFELATEVGADNRFQVPGARMWVADAALHRGEHARAIELLEPPRADRRTPTTSGWEDLILAKRAEALILAGDRGAAEAVALADSRPTADAHAATVALRARGLLESDDSVLGEACDRFAEFGQVPELARTQWLRGGDHRLEAERAFERLGAVRPA